MKASRFAEFLPMKPALSVTGILIIFSILRDSRIPILEVSRRSFEPREKPPMTRQLRP
jgi:hypothetical protein